MVYLGVLLLKILLLCFSFSSFSQDGAFYIHFSDNNSSLKCKTTPYSALTAAGDIDSIVILNSLSRCIRNLQSKGYLEARVDSISNHKFAAYVYLGRNFKWANLNADSLSNYYLRKAGIRKSWYSGKRISPTHFDGLANRVLRFYENNGHPFAKISFENLKIDSCNASINIIFDPGPKIFIDTLFIKGDAKISSRFIRAYLGANENSPFSQKAIFSYDEKLNSLGFLRTVRTTEIEFVPRGARIYTYLTNRSSSLFSGLVGFASKSDGEKGVQLSGDVNLMLNNTFRSGERNTLQWQSADGSSQRMNVSSYWPYILGSRIGINSGFRLFRRDTTYIVVNPELSIVFFLPKGGSIGLGYDYKVSYTTGKQSIATISDFEKRFYKISYSSSLEPSQILPIKQFRLSSSFSIGSRKVNLNMNPKQVKESTLAEISSLINFYYPLYRQTLVVHLQSQTQLYTTLRKDNDFEPLLENELYRIGGARVLRGFTQESILTDGYNVSTIELHLRLQQTLNFLLFFDQGLVSFISPLNNSKAVMWPQGFGFGVQVATQSGLFSINYSVGHGFGQSFMISKGLVNVSFSQLF